MAEVSIKGTTRTEFGKGASRRARVAGLVPAVIYGCLLYTSDAADE